MHPADSELVARVREGDVEAFAALVERHYRTCLRFAMRMLDDRADAEEAVQDAFVRAFRALPRYDDRNRFGAWLFRILVNRCRTVLARRKSRERLFVPLDVAAELAGPASTPDVEWSVDVQRALMRLRPALREALLLWCVEDLTCEEIARATGVGTSAVKMRVKRARDRMRELLKESHDAREALERDRAGSPA